MNIGTVGHVDHGKTSLVKALTGEWAEKHSEELKRGITIRLGYSDATIYKCPKCGQYATVEKCQCGEKGAIQRRVSFVDCPGHENLMAVMLSSASLMDAALLVIAANEDCPRPQTEEHLTALNIIGIKNIVVVQNKVDLVTREKALENYKQIKAFLKGTVAENAPIIPVAAHYNLNISALIEAIETNLPTPERDVEKDLKMVIARSFDINKPSSKVKSLRGGVIGGSILNGQLKAGEQVEIRPGIEKNGKYEPLITEAVTISVKDGLIDEAVAGGLIGVGTKLDPMLTKGDSMVGNIVGRPGKLPQTRTRLELDIKILDCIIGGRPEPLKPAETLVINAGTATSIGTVVELKKQRTVIELKKPICIDVKDNVALSRKIGTRWTMIGYGVVR